MLNYRRRIKHLAILISVTGVLLAAKLATAALPPPTQTYYIPIPETHSYQMFETINSATDTNIRNVISIAPNAANTLIVYDHFEDGYELDMTAPTQATTVIWGDNNPTNGIPPGFTNDLISAGRIISLVSVINVPHNTATIIYDGQDRFTSTKAVAVSYSCWPVNPGAVLADAIEVYNTAAWGTNYISPIGTDVASTAQFFEYTAFSIMASENGTVVRVDKNANGTFELTNTLNRGEAVLIENNILAGAQIRSSKPVQIATLTGDIGSSYEARWFTMTPVDDWCYCGVVPVTTTDTADPVDVFLYNQYTHSITVDVTTVSGASSFVVPPRTTYRYAMPTGSGARMLIRGQNPNAPTKFYTAVAIMDASETSNQDHDWGFTIPTLRSLTPQALVGWGPGADTNSPAWTGTENGSPVWALAVSNTTIYADFDANPATGPLVDPNGNRYNIRTNVTAFQVVRFFDNTDRDQTGMRVYTVDRTPIAVAWGQDPANSAIGNPYLDMGTTVPSLAVFGGSKTYAITSGDGDSRVEPGETMEYSLVLNNESFLAIERVTLIDPLPSYVSYVTNSTRLNGVAVPDNNTGTPYPLDAPGLTNIPNVASFSNVIVTFRVAVTNPFPQNVSTLINTGTFFMAEGELILRADTPVVQSDLELRKDVSQATAFVGSNILYTVTVTNRGPSAAEAVVVRDLLPSGVTYVSHTNGAYVPGTGLWTIGTLNAGSETTLQVRVLVSAAGVMTNVAQVWANGVFDPDSTPANDNGAPYEDDEDDAVFTAIPQVDLELRKTTSTNTPSVGGLVVFTVAVTNRGPSGATGVTVRDVLPAGLAYVSHAGGAYVPGTGIWTIGSLAAGGGTTLVMTASVTNSGSLVNFAQVQAQNEADVDSAPGNNAGVTPAEDDEGAVTLTVASAADVELRKSVNNAAPNVGGTVVFTLVLTNQGPNNATSVSVTDILPSGLSYVSHSGPGTYVPGTGIWSVGGPMIPGASRTLQITALVVQSGVRTNFAQVTTAGVFDPDSTPGNAPPFTEDDDDFVVLSTPAAADLELQKSVNNNSPRVSQSVVFTVTVTNRGPDQATGVTVQDLLPAGLAYVSHSGGAYNAGSGLWTIGTLNVGAATSLLVTATVTNSGVLANTAQVAAANPFDPDSTPANNNANEDDQDTEVLQVPTAGDLELSKRVNNAAPSVGSSIIYSITVTNRGPDAQQSVTVQDVLPSGLTYASHSGGLYAPGSGVWTIGSLNSGSSTTLQITAAVTRSGSITNFAQILSAQHDDIDSTPGNAPPYTEDDDDFIVIAVSPAADLALQKSVNNGNPNLLQNVIFTISVTNQGPDAATGVTVRDVLPAGLSYVSHTGGVYSNSVGIWTIGGLAVGGVTSLQVTATVTNSGVITNVAQVWTAGQYDSDSTPGNGNPAEDDQDDAIVSVGAAADLALTKTVNNPTPNVGATVTFTIRLTNSGPNLATGVLVSDVLPAGLSYASHSGGSYVTNTGVWNVGSLGVGSVTTLQISAVVNAAGAFTNMAQVAASAQYDPDSAPANNNPAEDDQASAVLLTPQADLELAKTVNNTSPNVQGTVIFTVTVTNRGPDAASGVTVRDILPAGLRYVSHGGGVYSTNTGVWTIGGLAVGSRTNLQITAVVTNSGTIQNIAQVQTADQFDPDSTPGNGNAAEDDQGNAVLSVPPASDLELVKNVNNASPGAGSQVAYTITVFNRGPDGGEGISVRDLLPAGVTHVSHAGGVYSPGTGIWNIGNLAVGSTVSLTITGLVNTAGSITNVAQIQTADHFDPDSTPANENGLPYEDDEDNAVINATPVIDLELGKTVSKAEADPFENIIWTITATNRGPSGATGVSVFDRLPTNWVYVSHSGGFYDTNTFVWSIGSLAAGAGTQLQIVAYATLGLDLTLTGHGPFVPGYTNVAQVWTANEPDADSTPGNSNTNEDDLAFAAIPVRGLSDLALAKTVDNASPRLNDLIHFRVVVTNEGPQPAVGVQVQDLLPAGVAYVSNSLAGAYNPTGGVWVIGTVMPGASTSLTIAVRVQTTGAFTNMAQVIRNFHFDLDSTPNNNAPAEDDLDEVIITPQPAADLELIKAADRSMVALGQTVRFAITLTNAGPDTATGVEVEDLLPGGFAYVSHNAGTYISGTGRWLAGDLNAGAVTSIQITATAQTAGLHTNTAQVSLSPVYDPDSTPGNDNPDEDDQDRASVAVIAPSITVEKTVGSDGIGSGFEKVTGTNGMPVIYTFLVRNTGDSALTNVTLIDDQIGYTNFIGTLAAGASTVITVNRPIRGGLVNTATVTGRDPLEGIRTDQDTAEVAEIAPGVSVVKTAGDAADGAILWVRPGTAVAYAYRITNTGDSFLTNIVVTDNVLGPVGVIAGPVAPGWSTNLVAIHSNVTADVVNVALVRGFPAGPGGEALPGLEEVTDTDDADTRMAFLQVRKEDTPDPVRPGQSLTYTLWVANPSAHAVTGVTVTEQYPGAFAYVSAVPAPAVGDNTWLLGDMAPGAMIPIVINGTVSGGAASGSLLTNIVSVTSTNGGSYEVGETTLVVAPPGPGRTEIRVTKRDDADPVAPGAALTYTIRVENFGPGTATNVTVTEAYDPLFAYAGSSPAPRAGTSNVWDLGSLAANTFVEITISGQVSTSAPNGYLVYDTVVARAANADPSRDAEVTLVGVQPPPDVTKTASLNPVLGGQVLIYTVTVANVSQSAVVSNVSVVESYDPLFLYSSSQPAPMSGTSNVWYLGDLPPGFTTNIVITGTVSMEARKSDILFNTVEVISLSGSRTVHLTTRVINVPPIPVTLLYFRAVNASGGVKLKWETATEFDNLGFNLYRADKILGTRVRINARLVPGSNASDGMLYKYIDTSAKEGVTYYYWLEEVSVDYKTVTYGPAVRTGSAGDMPAGVRPALGSFQTATTGGLYRIRYETLCSAGLPSAALDSAKLSIRINGVAVPVFVDAEGPTLQEGDSILFYAQASKEGMPCVVATEARPARMALADARPVHGAGDVLMKPVGEDQRVKFVTDPSIVRYFLIDFKDTPVWVLDVTQPTNAILMAGYSYVGLTNGLSAVYLSYHPETGPAKCFAVQNEAIIDVPRIRKVKLD